jgi:ankyrin repeat protein
LEERVKRFILSVVLMAAMVATALPQARPGQLATAIQEGKRAAALEMIRAGADVNEAQPDGTRPIHWAVYRVDYDLMDVLIAKKAKVDVTNEFGSTPLAEATKQGDARMVKTLLAAGSGTEGANADGQTALMIAIKNGDLPIFNMLIGAGAKVDAVEKVQNQTPLMWAAAANRNAAEMVKVLIAMDANVNARAKINDWPGQITSEPRAQYHTYGGLTPLLYAARGGCYACVEALVGSGANVNTPTNEGMTPLRIALDNSHNGVAKFFLDKGANPHVWDIYGRTALYVAVDQAPGAAAAGGGAGAGGGGGGGGAGGGGGGATVNTELLDLMVKHGADVNAQVNGADKYSGRVSYAWRDPNFTQSNEGMTALHVAARSQNSTLIKYLLAHGARTDIVDASGRTPLDVLDGVPALPPHVNADAEGLIPREALATVAPNAPATRASGGGARGAAPNPAVLEIRTMLQNAATKTQ